MLQHETKVTDVRCSR